MKPATWKPWPRTLKGRVTLQGLLVNGEGKVGDEGDYILYEWNDVAPAPQSGCNWLVLDGNGQPLKKQGRPLQISCRTCRASFVAQRLRSRWYRKAICSGLCLRERLEPPLKNRWPIILHGVTGVVVITAMCMNMASKFSWDGPKDGVFWTILGVLVAMYVASLILLSAVLYMALQLTKKLKIADVSYASTGIAFPNVDGDCQALSWAEIDSIEKESLIATIRTWDNKLYRFRTTPRSRAFLEAAIRLFIPNDLGRRRMSVGRINSRLGLFFAIGAGMVYELLFRVLPPEASQQSPLDAIAMLLGLGILVALGGAVYASVPDLEMQLAKRWFRLTRRFSRWWNRSTAR